LAQGVLRDASLFEHDTLIAPDLALYEVANTLWKHETLIGDLKDPHARIELLLELVANRRIQLVRPDKKLLDHTYALSIKHKLPVYDCVFVALALQLKTELLSLDGKQSMILSKEKQAYF
jgi:predicted nucleic acid-binding protein